MKKYALNAQFRAKWLAALRSGKFKQGAGALFARPVKRHKSDPSAENPNEDFQRYCCLGVAGRVCRIPAKKMADSGMFIGPKFFELPKALLPLTGELADELASKNDAVSENGKGKVRFENNFKKIVKYLRDNTVGVSYFPEKGDKVEAGLRQPRPRK